MPEEEKPKAQKKEILEAKLVQVPIQHELAVQLDDGSIVSESELLINMYNKILRIEKAVA